MKITDIKAIALKMPKVGTTVTGGNDGYDGNPYRNETQEETESWVGKWPHAGNIMTSILRVYTDEGIVGESEWESTYGFRGNLDGIKKNVIGMDVFDIQDIANRRGPGISRVWRNSYPTAEVRERNYIHMVEEACYDAIGKKMGLPVYKLFGGKVRERQAITLFVGEKPVDQAIKEIGQAISEGIKTIKLKVGANDKNDLEILKEVRRQFGWEDVILRVDANQAYDLADGARIIKRMSEYNLQYSEGCLRMFESYGFKKLRELTGVPVCICEQFNGYHTFTPEMAVQRAIDLIRMDCVDVLSIDPYRTGGLNGFFKVSAICEGAGVGIVLHRPRCSLSQSIWLTAVSTSYASYYAHDIVPFGQLSGPADEIAKNPLKHENGFMMVPDGPGFGVELDEEKIKKYTTQVI
ncbi:mandelate racemase/muconate lactonizing enzyme family protein [Breznakiella homolactica]|uniref:glucarate dehydratase n=1 Tax=Breznakiella homolactica TaxID=2798577 RepID=A0A7T8B8P5_9SPIR|nr:mandelate racemase/muconate lactonizing enzyme family protein [Breznakiella homolactica]QQO08824.1 mandelate racemase/muconate lactonizing enzyme family protein [Breznakiella homolactica]